MKLDPDLVREILLAYETLPFGGGSFEIEGYSEEQVFYHQEILEEAGFIKCKITHYVDGMMDLAPIRLTYQGHEFLNSCRDDKRWAAAKTTLTAVGGFVVEIAKDLLLASIRQQVNLP